MGVFSGRRGIPTRLERGSNRQGAISSQPILPNLPCPTGSLSGLRPVPPPVLLHRSWCWESPIPPVAQASEGKARGDTSTDSSLILAKPLQSRAEQTQSRLLQSLIKLKNLQPDPYGNGNMPSLAQSLSSHIGFQVPLSKYGSIRSFQRKDFLNYSNTAKNNVFFPGSRRPLKYLAEFFFSKKNPKRQSHDIRTGSCS